MSDKKIADSLEDIVIEMFSRGFSTSKIQRIINEALEGDEDA